MVQSIINMLQLFVVLLSFLCLSNNIISQVSNEKIIVGSKARFTVICSECIRMEYSERGKFVDEPSLFAANRNTSFTDFKIRNEEEKTIIETSRFRLIYKPDGKIFSPENLEVIIFKGNEKIQWHAGMKNERNLGGTLRTLDQVKGKVPLDDGVISRDGWFLMDDSKRPILTKDWVESRPEGSDLDWYLFAFGNDYKAALKALTKIGGEIPLPRKYALGSWYSRYWPYSSKDYHQIINEYEQYYFPLDIIGLDMDWHREGWTGWSWNKELLPDAEDLLKWFHQRNLFITLNVHPSQGIMPHEDMYKPFMKDMEVNLTGIPKDKLPTIPYDASNKKYLDNLFKHTHLPLEKEGVDFWWLDWQQFEYTLGNKDLKNLEWLNRYYFNYSMKDGKRGISFSRWGGWGDHKYPIHFSGDASTSWEMLEFEIPFTSTAGNVGCFFWSHDIGGHMGGINPETNARWVQFGATTAALRLHSTRDKTMDKRPWLFEDKYLQSMKNAFNLRSVIFPYIYSSVWQSCKESIPLNRPMYIEYSEEKEAYNQPQQYFFGDAFLVAPITQAGIGKNNLAYQKVWFPKGVWYNWFSREKFNGDKNLTLVWADIYEFPMYAKGGIPIPIQPFTQRMTTEPLRQLVIRTYPGEDKKSGEFTLYEDDGISQEYIKGKFGLTRILYQRDGENHQIEISPVNGNYSGQLLKRSYVIEFPDLQKADGALVNGKLSKVEYDENDFMNKILIPETSVTQKLTISIKAKEADYNLLQKKAEDKRKSGLSDIIDFQKSPTDNIGEILEMEIDPIDKNGIISLLSGVAFFVEDATKIIILKSADSEADNIFKLAITDNTSAKSTDVLNEEFEIKKGELKVFNISKLIAGYLPVNRMLNLKFNIYGKDIEFSKIIDEKIPYICNWNIIGPYDYDQTKNISEYSYEPEKVIDLTASYNGKENKNIKWQQVECTSASMIDFNNYFPSEYCIAYAVTNIKSETDQNITFKVSSDDGIEMRLNNEKIHSNNVFRGVEPDVDKVEGKLKRGKNILLVKVSQGSGGWAFRVNYECTYPVELNLK